MANYYLDLINGNDSNDGTTFANRKKTWAGAAALTINPGDSLFVAKTGDPVSIGNATWTEGTNNIVLAAAQTANVDACEAAWTAGTGITSTTSTTQGSSAYREGTKCILLTVGAGYTNGTIAAYKSFTSTDFSAYQQLNFYAYSSAVTSAGDWRIDLCSDTVGATSVYSFSVPAISATNGATAFVIDKGALLTLATAIQSVSVTRVSGTGTPNFSLDNIFLSNPPNTTGCITLYSMFGKNIAPTGEGTTGVLEWYGVKSVNGTVVTALDNTVAAPNTTLTISTHNETVTTYARPYVAFTSGQAFQGKAGTASGGFITVQGGCDPATSMTTVTGDTVFGLVSSLANASSIVVDGSYLIINNFGVVGSGSNAQCLNHLNGNINRYNNCYWTGGYNGNCVLFSSGGGFSNIFTNCCSICLSPNSTGPFQIISPNSYINNSRFLGGTSSPLYIIGTRLTINSCAFIGSLTYGLRQLDNSGQSGNAVVRNCFFRRNTQFDFIQNNNLCYFDNCIMNSTNEVSVNGGTSVGWGQYTLSTNHDGIAGNHIQFHDGGRIASDTAVRHTASGISWKMSPTATYRNAYFPLLTKIAVLAVTSGTPVTVSAYFAKSHSDISTGLFIRGGQIGGPTSDTTQLSTVGTTSTFETTPTQITWTPSASGVVEIEAICYTASSVTASAWVDDMNFS